MQNDVVSVLARESAYRLEYFLNKSDDELNTFWNFSLDAESVDATQFQIIWSMFYDKVWKERFAQTLYPSAERTLQILNSDSSSHLYFDDMKNLIQQMRVPLMDSLANLKEDGRSEWYKVKGTQLTHLAKLDAFSYKNLKIGGSGNTINAVKKTHGPSWRMIVEMGKDSITGYGVYPGGQSGNPGSKYYGTFINNWVEGKYYPLVFLPNKDKQDDKRIKYTWVIN